MLGIDGYELVSRKTWQNFIMNGDHDINLMIDPEAAKIALTADFPKVTYVAYWIFRWK